MTELANRTLFRERLYQAVAAAQQGNFCALLCLDLDHFKAINDTLGHPVGDHLLRAVAERLLAATRAADTVARLGGDEFAIVQADLTSPEDAALLAKRILDNIGQPFEIGGHRIVATMSIGISIAPVDGITSEALLRTADAALYLAKSQGRGIYRCFQPTMDATVQELRVAELDLRNAVPAQRLRVALSADSGSSV